MDAINALKSWLTVNLGIDMGTTRTRIFQGGKGIVLNEPSYISISYRDREPQDAGSDAHKSLGRCPPYIEVHRPLSHGIIENFDLAEAMLNIFLNRVFRRKALLGARIVMVVPAGATDVEKKAFEDIAVQVGGREVYLIEAPIAAAIGMGLPIRKEGGLVSLYLGGDSTQAVVFTNGEVLFTHYEAVGGESLTDSIIAGIRKNHKIHIGKHTGEQLKLSMGSAYPTEKDETREIYGKSVEDGLPRSALISNWEVREMMQDPLERIIGTINSVFERMPPELSEDIKKSGVSISGGNSQVRGLVKLVGHITGLKVTAARNAAMSCVAGTEVIMANPSKFRDLTVSSHSRQFTG